MQTQNGFGMVGTPAAIPGQDSRPTVIVCIGKLSLQNFSSALQRPFTMSEPAANDITTDYLVIGAGIVGLGFVDELLTRTTASITIVDKNDAPGGHWNCAYSFVKLHAPSRSYGVESTELPNLPIEESGLNKGLLGLNTGPEIVSYCHSLMRDRFLPSGRVTYLPSTEYVSDGVVRGVHSGRRLVIHIKKKLVDATWYTNAIPATHTRAFTTDPSVTCVPPNDLPKLAHRFKRFSVLGGGKTGIDSCIWLLSNGVDPDQIQWVIPNDSWFINRAQAQIIPEFFSSVLRLVAAKWESVGEAKDLLDMAHRLE
jgi:hypothetical protein